ncbi:DinB family protein [Peribacillus frigoritolerans]|uniref:DinB family protein n=1 Tax=Peribacillus frigoritolerans TaxID=450367 RepID=UPI0025A3112F|nr:DinB family protein [Peribacillus frigoritolerans]MDM5308375.1 DinB family protein [Peribacillus frigoritolerans]
MNLFDLLLESSKKLIEEVKMLNYEKINEKPALDKWSISQICHHLYLSEKLFTKAIENGLKDKDYESVVHKPIHLVSDRFQKFESPEIAKPSEDPLEVETILNFLTESRENLLNVLRAIDDKSILSKKVSNHPAFGELSLEQWIELLYLHEQRHIEQIKDVKLSKSFG